MGGHSVLRGRHGMAALAGAACAIGLLAPGAAQAQWDSIISNSHWYVTVPQMLAYAAPSTSFANPIPIGDQTLWALGTSTNGVFTGTSSAQLAIGPILTTSDSNIQGTVSPAGQIIMVFTPTTGGSTTIGIGQMAERGGVTEMEMQMITGTSLLVSHWAYMVPYNPATFTPPAAQAVPSNASPQWAWTAGTPWRISSPGQFGTATPGRFIISDYKSGYFWGQGVTPAGTAFTLLGSITPEGKVLFNTLTNGALTSLYGGITGDAAAAQMLLGTYDSTGVFTGDLSALSLVQPYAQTVVAANTLSSVGAARTLYAIASTPASLTGAFAPTFAALDSLQGPALNSAVGQTVPLLAGAASQITANSQRALQQVIGDRVETLRAAATGPDAERHVWLRPLGGISSQTSTQGVPGYSTGGGGIAAGIDTAVSPALSLGAVFAYSYTAADGTGVAAANALDISSYVFGLYGAYALAPGLELDLRGDLGLNRNAATRGIAFIASTASADYDSTSAHAGIGLRQEIPLAADLALVPALRLDYLRVDADAYTETGAGALNLHVQGQTYQELFLSGALRLDYRMGDVTVNARGGLGYNLLPETNEISAAFIGGGTPFLTQGLDVSPWLFTAGLGIATRAGAAVTLGAQYDLQASPSGYLGQMAALQFRMRL